MRAEQSIGRHQIAYQIVSECIAKYAVVFAFALAWKHFMYRDVSFRLLEHIFFTAGAIFLAAAWFCYLKLDHLCVHYLLEKREKPHRNRETGMMDHVETEPDSSDELSEKQKTICHLISDILTGAGFIFVSIMVSLFVV